MSDHMHTMAYNNAVNTPTQLSYSYTHKAIHINLTACAHQLELTSIEINDVAAANVLRIH